MLPGGLIRCNASSSALFPASLGPTKIVFPGSISNKPVSRVLRYFLTRAFLNRIDLPPAWQKNFLKKTVTDYDKNPKNLIHRSAHVVHKFRNFRSIAAHLDDWSFDAQDRHIHFAAERKRNQTRRG